MILILVLGMAPASWPAEAPPGPVACAANAPEWIRAALHRRRRLALADQSGIKVFLAEVPRDASVPRATAIVWAEAHRTRRTTFEVADLRVDADIAATFDRIVRPSDIVLINGGFWGYGQDQRTPIPLGLVVANGKTVVKRIGWTSGGIVYATPTVFRVARARDALPSDGLTAALQSKPMVVADGMVDIRTETGERYNRTAVGVRRDGPREFIVLAGAFSPDDQGMTMCEFAEFLSTSRRAAGPAVTEALSMDGGPGAHFALPGARDARLRHFGVEAVSYVPNVVRVGRTMRR